MRPVVAGLTALLAAAGVRGEAQDRPAEDDLFKGPPPAEVPAAGTRNPPPDAGGERPSETDIIGGTAPGPGQGATELAPENPLTIGGLLYFRAQARAQEGVPVESTRVSAPTLLDGYFDARPNERLRGFVAGRVSYDPLVDPNASSGFGLKLDPGPKVLLDQAWLRLDVLRTVFVTAGRQRVKWGSARFWNPTDVLNPTQRDPLAVFDARTGVTMVKLHVPWEARAWNFYALALLDNFEPSATLGQIGGAMRVEMVLGPAEVSIGGVLKRGRTPKLTVDVSSALGPLDVYAEGVLRQGSDVELWRAVADPDESRGVLGKYESYYPEGFRPAVTAGAYWTVRYNDEDSVTVGAEYAYNANGYSDPSVYPILLFRNEMQPFYLGRHYAALYAMLPNPGAWNNTTFMLSSLGNLSDMTFVSRLDYIVRVLTHLQLEAYAMAHYGHKGGEFRFALDLEPQTVGGQTTPPMFVPVPLFEVGLGLRVNI